MMGSETFIIVALRCSEKSTSCALASSDLLGEEGAQRAAAHEAGVDDVARKQRHAGLQHLDAALAVDVLDAGVASLGLGDRVRELVAAQVAGHHVRHVRLGIRRPGAHRVRVLAGVRP
jgi:hypothetical protein